MQPTGCALEYDFMDRVKRPMTKGLDPKISRRHGAVPKGLHAATRVLRLVTHAHAGSTTRTPEEMPRRQTSCQLHPGSFMPIGASHLGSSTNKAVGEPILTRGARPRLSNRTSSLTKWGRSTIAECFLVYKSGMGDRSMAPQKATSRSREQLPVGAARRA